MQPLFEAISNAIHATQDLFMDQVAELGRINVSIDNLDDPVKFVAVVSDNGIGLTPDRYEAFCTTDTNYKVARGGKGIGRLLWLDAFSFIHVRSTFQHQEVLQQIEFSFKLDRENQICDEKITNLTGIASTGTSVTLRGLRTVDYQKKFPSRPKTIIRHFGSHFLADFIVEKTPKITLSVSDSIAVFPEAVTNLLHDTRPDTTINAPEYGPLQLSSFIFLREASMDFEGLHQLHFVAGGRTVMTRKIDGLLGIGHFGKDHDLVYHGCLSGSFLEERVNQERTYFNFNEATAEELSRACANDIRANALKDEIQTFDSERLSTMRSFLADYPSFGFEEPEMLLQRTPKNATKPEAFAKALIPLKIRRDEERRARVETVVQQLRSDSPTPGNFTQAVRDAANDVRAEEQRQLTEYVLRRKIVLDVLAVLIRRVRESESGGKRDHNLEQTLHQFICPMRVRGDDRRQIERSAHDLWIVDERLALARYFSSDLPLNQILEAAQTEDRPDILVWDRVHGLLEGNQPLNRVLIVEFKRPGRKHYDERYLPNTQIVRYLADLKAGRIETFQGERVEIAQDCVFHCYVVADIVGELDTATSAWQTTASGRGRYFPLAGAYRGSIEIIEWRDLITDARARNAAFVEASGVSFAKS
jgi:hypothetical protein